MKNKLSFLLCFIMFIVSLSGCTYDPPEGYTPEHHTYDEIITFAQTIDPDAVVSEDYKDTQVKDWNRKFREWPTLIGGMECHVSSVGDMVWNSGFCAGEFAKQYYILDTDYDYLLLQKIVSEKQPHWHMKYDDISSRYNWNNLLGVQISTDGTEQLTDDELEVVWQYALEIYTEYNEYPVRKEAFFCLTAPSKFYNQSDNEYYVQTDSYVSIDDFSEQGKSDFFQKYHDAWALLESDMRIEK